MVQQDPKKRIIKEIRGEWSIPLTNEVQLASVMAKYSSSNEETTFFFSYFICLATQAKVAETHEHLHLWGENTRMQVRRHRHWRGKTRTCDNKMPAHARMERWRDQSMIILVRNEVLKQLDNLLLSNEEIILWSF